MTDLLGMAVIGVGYWGPNLVRNVSANPRMQLRWVCDLDLGRARAAVGHSSTALLTRDISEVLDDPQVDAVAIATPAANHLDVGMAAINARKNVLVEKPLATTAADARRLAMLAAEAGLVLMCDHTYCYTPAVAKIRELVASGVLGEVQYVDSVRIGLGLVQPDVDVLWDLAPHDLSVLDFVLPDHMNPLAVAAHAADPIGTGRNCVAYLTLTLPRRAIAHAHVNWLSPTKIRTMIIGGSQRMLVWDDLNPAQRVSIFDRGVDLVDSALATEERREALVSYRTGDMTAPALPEREALANVLDEFLDAIVTRRAPATDGWAGLRVLTTLEAAARSIEQDGALVPLSADAQ